MPELADAAKWSKSDIELFAPTVELRRLIHDYSRDDKEFNRYMESLKASTLTAFYTDNRIVDAISDALKYQGVEIKVFLNRLPDRERLSTLSCAMTDTPEPRCWLTKRTCSPVKSCQPCTRQC